MYQSLVAKTLHINHTYINFITFGYMFRYYKWQIFVFVCFCSIILLLLLETLI